MRIAMLAAGAADMYCGSCLRDNTLAGALRRAGHQVMLVPLYTPLRTELEPIGIGRVFFGGLNVYLRQMGSVFRAMPGPIRRLLDRPKLLNWAGKKGAGASSAKLGPLTLGILNGDHGPQAGELARLIAYIKSEFGPQVITLPNAMFLGLAKPLKDALGTPVICELTGEDLFLDGIDEPYRERIRTELRRLAPQVDRFVATSASYAAHMAEYLDLDPSRISTIHPGLPKVYFETPRAGILPHPPTVGYMARLCPEKGLDRLIDAMLLLKQRPGMERVALRAAGYLAGSLRPWLADQQARAAAEGLDFQYLGEVDLGRKLEFLDSLDVLSVPTHYKEAKGLYVLEAAARGVPVVQPNHGSFPELLAKTGGGVLVRPDDPQALADGLYELLSDPGRRAVMGQSARRVAMECFTDTRMAEEMVNALCSPGLPTGAGRTQESPATENRLWASGVRKSFPMANGSLEVLRGVELQMAPGETLAILGPSGSGKSTLLNILGALDRPTAGTVTLNGTDLPALSARDADDFRARSVGFVFQDHHLLPQCTALENVLLARLALGKVEEQHIARATERLGQLGLGERLHHRPPELSGGERQRVSIARAMMNRPLLLLCDEPTGNLDAATATRIGEELCRLAAGTATMLVVATHSAALAGMLQRRLRLEAGRLIEV